MADKLNILIVDDEKDFLEAISTYLNKEGYSTKCSQSGKEALEILKSERPDLVLLDVVMPDFDGVDTLAEIRKIYPDLAVIMITAYTSNKRIIEAEEYGVTGFFRKSSDFSHAAKMIKTFLKKIEGESDN